MEEINWQPHHLSNDTVELRPLQLSDFESLYAVASDPLLWEQHPAWDRYKREVFAKLFDKAIASGKAFLILDKTKGTAIGSTRFYDEDIEKSEVCIGYTFISRAYWANGTNRAVKTLMLDYAFSNGFKRVLFHVAPGNFRSRKAVEKLGAQFIREFTKEENGALSHHVEYALTLSDWQKNNENAIWYSNRGF